MPDAMGVGPLGCLDAGCLLPALLASRRCRTATLDAEAKLFAEKENKLILEPAGSSLLPLLGDSGSLTPTWSISSETDRDVRGGFAEKTLRHLGCQPDPDCGIGYACRKGLKPEYQDSPNQDSFIVVGAEGFCLYGVFDGHGPDGHEISNFVKEHLPTLIMKDARLNTPEMPAMLKDAFLRVQGMIEKATQLHKVNASMSGTTVTIVIHDQVEQKLTVAYAGDSSSCVGKLRNGRHGRAEAMSLTRDHKPYLREERTRIEKAGGQVLFDGYASHRVYARNTCYPGLNMSRTLGDLLGHSSAGLSAEPTISELSLTAEDHVLLICSDGVWDFIPPLRAVEEVSYYSPSKAMVAAEHLVAKAWDSWIAEEGGEIVDDITALVVFLQPPLVEANKEDSPKLVNTPTALMANQMWVGGARMNIW